MCQNFLSIFPEISVSNYIRINPYFKEKNFITDLCYA